MQQIGRGTVLFRIFTIAICVSLFSSFVNCGEAKSETAETTPKVPDAKKGNSKKELALFEDLPQVISASRRAEPISLSSAPVSVLNANDIHYSGLTTLPELFHFIPGVDVLTLDRNRYAIGVHGLHDYFSDRTLSLINGRNAESPVFGGSEFLRYPLFMEDIERIEVVRGPGGAAWGANAFNGVVNIITKKPEDAQGIRVSGTVNEFGETSSHVRWGASKGKWTWRTSFGYDEHESSEAVIDDDKFISRDFAQKAQFDGEANYTFSDQTKLSIGAAYQYQKMGDFEFIGIFPKQNGHFDTTRAFARVDHAFTNGVSGYLQWFGNFADSEYPSIQANNTAVNDLETQLTFNIAEHHHLTVGANMRWMHITTDPQRSDDIQFPGEPFDEFLGGVFALYRWEATRRLTFEAQVRGDHSSETNPDWASRLTVLYALDEEQRHIFRAGGAKAFRSPYIGLRDTQVNRGELPEIPGVIPAGSFVVNGTPNNDLGNEEVYTGELGYSGRLTDALTLRIDGYINRYEELIGFVQQLFPIPGVGNGTNFTARNVGGANAYGAEIEVTYKIKRGQISGWFSYNDVQTDFGSEPLRSYRPSKNKAGLSGRLFLAHDVALNLNYRYSDISRGDMNNDRVDAHAFHRLDFTASKTFKGGKFAIMAGVTDLLNKTRDPTRGIGNNTVHETPGRTFFGRFQLKF